MLEESHRSAKCRQHIGPVVLLQFSRHAGYTLSACRASGSPFASMPIACSAGKPVGAWVVWRRLRVGGGGTQSGRIWAVPLQANRVGLIRGRLCVGFWVLGISPLPGLKLFRCLLFWDVLLFLARMDLGTASCQTLATRWCQDCVPSWTAAWPPTRRLYFSPRTYALVLRAGHCVLQAKPLQERRWASVSLEQRRAVYCAPCRSHEPRRALHRSARSAAACSWRALATVYCPGCKWHYQLRWGTALLRLRCGMISYASRIREPPTKEGDRKTPHDSACHHPGDIGCAASLQTYALSGPDKDRKEFNLVFQKAQTLASASSLATHNLSLISLSAVVS